jgi:hypothetical protein
MTYGGGGGAIGQGIQPVERCIALSPMALMMDPNVVKTSNVGSASTGGEFILDRAGMVVMGVQFFWADATATTLKVSLWGFTANPALATGSMAVSAVGWYYIPFTTPFVTQAQAGTPNLDRSYRYSVFDTNGRATLCASGRTQMDHFPATDFTDAIYPYGGPDLRWVSWALFSSGDAIPATDPGGTTTYPVEPVVVHWKNTTAAPFTMPAVNASVSVTMSANTVPYLRQGMTIQVQGAGTMLVASVASDPTISLINTGDAYNAPATTVVAAGAIAA